MKVIQFGRGGGVESARGTDREQTRWGEEKGKREKRWKGREKCKIERMKVRIGERVEGERKK